MLELCYCEMVLVSCFLNVMLKSLALSPEQDWADMLLRMYVRWGEQQRYKTMVVEKSPGEEAGIKSATIEIEGRYVYGYLLGEKGTHRIVRQSPFNSKGLRQVSPKVCSQLTVLLLWLSTKLY